MPLLRGWEDLHPAPHRYEVLWNGTLAKQHQTAQQRPAPVGGPLVAYPTVSSLLGALTRMFEPACVITRRAGVHTCAGASMLHRLAERGYVDSIVGPNPRYGLPSQRPTVRLFRVKGEA